MNCNGIIHLNGATPVPGPTRMTGLVASSSEGNENVPVDAQILTSSSNWALARKLEQRPRRGWTRLDR